MLTDTAALFCWEYMLCDGLAKAGYRPFVSSPARRRLVRRFLAVWSRHSRPASWRNAVNTLLFFCQYALRLSPGQQNLLLQSLPLPASRKERLGYLNLLAKVKGPRTASRAWRNFHPRPVITSWQEAFAWTALFGALPREEHGQCAPSWARLFTRWMREMAREPEGWKDVLQSIEGLTPLFHEVLTEAGPARARAYLLCFLRAALARDTKYLRVALRWRAWYYFGGQLERHGLLPEAIQAYRQALRGSGAQTHAGLFLPLIRLEMRLSKPEEAREDLAEALFNSMGLQDLQGLRPLYRRLFGKETIW